MLEPTPIKTDTKIRIYKDDEPVDIPMNEFFKMLEDLKHG